MSELNLLCFAYYYGRLLLYSHILRYNTSFTKNEHVIQKDVTFSSPIFRPKAICCFSDTEDLYKIFVKRLTMATLVICMIALSRLFLLRYMSRNKELCRTVKNMQFRISSLKALTRSNRPLYSNGRGIYVSSVMMDTFASVRLLCGKSVVTPVAE